MRTFLVAAACLGFSIAGAGACDFHNSSASASAATSDSMTVASIATPRMSKATGAMAEKPANPVTKAPGMAPAAPAE